MKSALTSNQFYATFLMFNTLRVGGTTTTRRKMNTTITVQEVGRAVRDRLLMGNTSLFGLWYRYLPDNYPTLSRKEVLEAAGITLADVIRHILQPAVQKSQIHNFCAAGELLREQGYAKYGNQAVLFLTAQEAGLSVAEAHELVSCLLGERQACPAST